MSESTAGKKNILDICNLKMHFPITKGFLEKQVGTVKAVDDVSFSIREGETLGLVGESGCGKTTLGRCVLRVYKPTAGNIMYQAKDGASVDLAVLTEKELKPFRREIRMIFQDPQSSLNPRHTILEIIGEPLMVNKIASGTELEDRVVALLKRVGLRPEYLRRYPHAFSGGERQRIGIARALALNPRLVVADEAVSALDVSVQAQTLNLLQELQKDFSLTYLFVAHNLSVVQHVCERVAVMYVGRLMELADTREMYFNPKHPYTEALMSAVPKPDPQLKNRDARIRLEGEVADPAHPPAGCHFHPRCRYAQEKCRTEIPAIRDIGGGHLCACHFAESLKLKGVEV
ncbi:ATP-binding cassette domain-containing protein [Treponema sp. OttesenSCG-928-L16]|nr:ATP-binding cassette domain-containing protein [Treponema sp. OttesenSCG-928-L16]